MDRRTQILTAAERVVTEKGADAVSLAQIMREAHVSRSAFLGIFADRDDCLMTLFDEVTDRMRTRLHAAYLEQGSWLDGVRAGLDEVLDFLDDDPRLARFLVVGGLSGGSALVARRRRVLDELAHALEANAPVLPDTSRAPFGGEALIGGVASIVHARLLEDPAPPLRDLSGCLMAAIVLPFLGEAAARRELTRFLPRGGGEGALRARQTSRGIRRRA